MNGNWNYQPQQLQQGGGSPDHAAAPNPGLPLDADDLDMSIVLPAQGAPADDGHTAPLNYDISGLDLAWLDEALVQDAPGDGYDASYFFDQAMVGSPGDVFRDLTPFDNGFGFGAAPAVQQNHDGSAQDQSNVKNKSGAEDQSTVKDKAGASFNGLYGEDGDNTAVTQGPGALVGGSNDNIPAINNSVWGAGGLSLGDLGGGLLQPQHGAIGLDQSAPAMYTDVDLSAFLDFPAIITPSQGLTPSQDHHNLDAGNLQAVGLASGPAEAALPAEDDYDAVLREIQGWNGGHFSFDGPAEPAPVAARSHPTSASATATTAAALPATPAHAGLPASATLDADRGGDAPQAVAVPNIRHLTREQVGPSGDRPAQFRPLTAADWRRVAAADLRHYSGPELRLLREGLEELVSQAGVAEAQGALRLAEAFTRRRRQLSNNRNADRSRRRARRELQHWRRLALRLGAPDLPFVYRSDEDDEDDGSGAQ